MRSLNWMLLLVLPTMLLGMKPGTVAAHASLARHHHRVGEASGPLLAPVPVDPSGAAVVIPIQAEEGEERVTEERGPSESGSERAWLGVELQELDEALREAFDYKGGGVLVGHVVPGSPADRAGIEKGDIIVRVDGRRVRNPAQVTRRIRSHDPGDRVEITRLRKGRESKVEATLAGAPEDLAVRRRGGPLRRGGYLGARVEALSADLAPYFEVEAESGVLVVTVEDDSPAARAGLKAGDVITQVGGERVRSPEELVRAIHEEEPGAKVTLTAIRRGRQQTIEATLAAAPPMERLRHLVRHPGELEPMLQDLRLRMREGRDALAARVEKLEEIIRDLERRVDELGERKRR